ncbi:hypothetical protein R5R35_008873 [Gryllus longicercus]|uniref:Uncharacterized protein n=1 Tax=Gryllus longicercus TaxID=2509291 RepID=A0AAN9VLP9_9ORTH
MQEGLLELVREPPGPAFIVSLDQARPLLHGPILWDAATGASFAHPVPQCLLSPAYVSYPTRPRWPQQRVLDALLGIAAQAGIFTKLDSDMWINLRALGIVHGEPDGSTSTSHKPTAEEPRPLRLSALLSPGAVLCVGTLAATVAFLGERALRMRACRTLVNKTRLLHRLHSAAPPRWTVHAY